MISYNCVSHIKIRKGQGTPEIKMKKFQTELSINMKVPVWSSNLKLRPILIGRFIVGVFVYDITAEAAAEYLDEPQTKSRTDFDETAFSLICYLNMEERIKILR
jgi:hypothetical protein